MLKKKSKEKTKNKSKQRKQSLSKKLNMRLIIVLFLIFAALTTYNSISNYNSEYNSSLKLVTKDSEVFAERLKEVFSDSYKMTEILQNEVKEQMKLSKSKRSRDELTRSLESLYESCEYLYGLGIYFEPNAFDGKDKDYKKGFLHSTSKGRFAAYAYKDGGSILIDPAEDLEDSSTNTYYTEPLAIGKSHLGPPEIFDINGTGILMVSYNIPIKNESGKIIGLIQADISLNEVQEKMLKYRKNFKSTYYTLVSDEGIIAGHSLKPEKVTHNELKKHPNFKAKYQSAASGTPSNLKEISSSTGKETEYVFTTVPIAGTNQHWTIQTSTPYEDFIAETKQHIYVNIITYIIILIGIGIIIKVLVDRMVAKPVKYIASAMNKIANYNLNTEEERKALTKYRASRDEIGDMTRAIRLMVTNLKSIVENIISHAQNTAATAEELTATSQSTAESAGEVASAVGNIAEGATSQAQDTTDAAHSIEENTNSLDEMIQILHDLEEANHNIDTKKDEGKKAINDLYKLSEENKKESEMINKIILETNESAEAISKASEMIQSIADQTNLLALNAAIDIAYSM